MQAAPPVAVVCDGGGAWRLTQAILNAGAAAAFCAWLAGHLGAGDATQAATALAAAILAGWLAWRAAAPQPQTLSWDGQQWLLGSPGVTGDVDVMIDLGPWLLLRHTAQAPGVAVTWLPVAAREVAGGLHGLRVALYARAPAMRAGLHGIERQAP